MGHKKLILSFFVTFCISLVCQASSSGESIGNRARSYIGSRTWLYSSSHETGENTNKCNIFVADVLNEENCPAPNRGLDFREEYLKVEVLQSITECPVLTLAVTTEIKNDIAQTLWLRSDKLNVISVLPNRWWWYSPIGAGEWENSNSEYLNSSRCWQICYSPVKGDVIAMGGHVGIVSGYRNTTSASALANPQGLIVENDWGFRSGENATCWRYRHNISDC